MRSSTVGPARVGVPFIVSLNTAGVMSRYLAVDTECLYDEDVFRDMQTLTRLDASVLKLTTLRTDVHGTQ
jgi:hypothetical protein